jgi:DNA-binding transcriptional LysR family regulator
MVTLAQLRHFVALADAGSFSKTAEVLHLTQPALSRSIQALEAALGRQVFNRVGRRIELTPFGQEALRRARQLVGDAQALSECRFGAMEEGGGRLRLGLGSGPGAMLMTPLMVHMARHHPRVQFEIARGTTDALTPLLRDRHLDALVVDIRALPPARDLVVEPVSEMRGAFMCRHGHPLARRGRPITFDVLRAYPLASIHLSDEIARQLVERYGPQAHPSECVTLCCNELAGLLEVARSSDAILLAIRGAAPDLVELRLDPPMVSTARFGIVRLAKRPIPSSFGLVRQRVLELLRD